MLESVGNSITFWVGFNPNNFDVIDGFLAGGNDQSDTQFQRRRNL